MEKFVCEQCGGEFLISRVGLGMNLGSGPEYFCDQCRPPASAKDCIETIEAFIKPDKA